MTNYQRQILNSLLTFGSFVLVRINYSMHEAECTRHKSGSVSFMYWVLWLPSRSNLWRQSELIIWVTDMIEIISWTWTVRGKTQWFGKKNNNIYCRLLFINPGLLRGRVQLIKHLAIHIDRQIQGLLGFAINALFQVAFL